MAIRQPPFNRAKPQREQEAGPQKELPIAEIVTGVVIVLILVFMGLPKLINWWRGVEANQEVVTFYDRLVMAQNTAVEKRKPVSVVFFPDRNAFSVHEDTNGNDAVDAGEFHEEFGLGEHLQYYGGSLPDLKNVWNGEPVGDRAVHLFGGGTRLTFNPLGQTSDNGAVYLIPKWDVGITAKNMRALKFLKTSGEIRVLHHTGQDDVPWK
ncbi:GspH/FimT family protein [Nitrospina gracilis]|uniref:GspH/FimT family protein n=1 Tax=Nitrospina gracilis TaxID=35801 RepID=UPI001F3DDC57|nr:GspH/FimT family protein [Nitrospina gracilis]MCF8721123.1 Tfp pilus assembly protein FimT [Nitrospina gracilis Nb-211]